MVSNFLPFIVIIGGIIYFMTILWIREFVKRPIAVSIVDDGILLQFRHGKPKFVEWSEVVSLNLTSPDSGKLFGKSGDGAIQIRNQTFPYQLSYQIAKEIQIKYEEACEFR